MRWRESWRADPTARRLADGHYNRQKPGADQFVPPGRCVVLVIPEVAFWIAEIALAREARDAIQDDIVRLEDVRARLEDRLAEAYEHRAMLDLRILTLRSR